MLTALMMVLGGGLLMLRLGPQGSFSKPLSPEEESDCVCRWADDGDMDARNRLIEHNMRLVAHVMKKYYTGPEEMDDLISIGTIGLIKAVDTYRPEKKVRLATYASRCIENVTLTCLGVGPMVLA